jgi:antitoxin (DNA-binding transcriptional repressor) of toxin-antitoxin stability system
MSSFACQIAIMRSLCISKFKRECLKVLDNLDSDGVIITKNGMPVAHIMPIRSDCADLIGCMKGKIKIHGNIFSTETEWDSEPMIR